MSWRDEPGARLCRARGALWRSGDFGVVVLGTRRAEPVTLEGTAVTLWDLLAEPCRRRDLVARLARRFADDPDRIARDIDPVLDELVVDGVLEATG